MGKTCSKYAKVLRLQKNVEKPEGQSLLERPRLRWNNNIEINF